MEPHLLARVSAPAGPEGTQGLFGTKDIIEYLRKERPYDYVRIVVSLLPNEVPTWRIEDMTDDELAIVLRALIAQQEALQRSEPAEPDNQSSAGGMA